jgi:hypothetical protein
VARPSFKENGLAAEADGILRSPLVDACSQISFFVSLWEGVPAVVYVSYRSRHFVNFWDLTRAGLSLGFLWIVHVVLLTYS